MPIYDAEARLNVTDSIFKRHPDPGHSAADLRTVRFAAWALLAVALILFLWRAWTGIHLFEFGDESEKFVIAKMLDQGLHLYRDIFSHHGPVPYMVAHLYSSLVSASDFTWARVAIVLLAGAAGASVVLSPAIRTVQGRILATIVFLWVLSAFWVLQSLHMLMYQSIGGFLLLIAFAQWVAPALLGEKPRPVGVFVSAFVLVMACFSAYAFGPAAVLMTASAMIGLVASRTTLRAHAAPFLLGVLVALTLAIGWMLLFADLPGYLVYHFYFNQYVYIQHSGASFQAVLNSFKIALSGDRLVHTAAVLFFAVWAFAMTLWVVRKSVSQQRGLLRIVGLLLLLAAVPFMNPRGGTGFQGATFVIFNIGALALSVGVAYHALSRMAALGVVVLVLVLSEAAAHYSVSSPHGVARKDFGTNLALPKPLDQQAHGFIRAATNEQDPFVALIFDPIRYVRADRLPASGHFNYLPWQAAYERASVAGYQIDICADLEQYRPKVIWFDNWKVWDRYWMSEYEPCVIDLIGKHYRHVQEGLYLRSDMLVRPLSDQPAVGIHLRPSRVLSATTPIRLSMVDEIEDSAAKLKRIGIRFGTHRRIHQGKAELRLKDEDGETFVSTFALHDLQDNEYRYFDLEPGRYVSGEIAATSGGGVSTWEIAGRGVGQVKTCIVYVDTDGRVQFTKGCPVF